MAQPPVLKSLDGRNFGRDRDGFMTSPLAGLRTKGFEFAVTTLTTGSTVTASGVGLVSTSTGAKSFTLAAPAEGAVKHLMHNTTSTSTAAITFTLVSGNLQSTASSTYTAVTLNGAGQYAQLIGQSTSRYQVASLSAGAVLS
jgi:hypothetical protein